MTNEQVTIEILKRENQMLRSLLKHGKIYVRYSSTDCDGVYSQRNCEFDSIEEYNKALESEVEWADGPFNFRVVDDKSELFDEDQCGTFGQGWGIN